ncbi:MAG: DUF6261 family protein [Tannerellaceae bacterium]|jgi:hypothetical protein|nr:DUF6261 family protein [Tannerellaceae bacterium]
MQQIDDGKFQPVLQAYQEALAAYGEAMKPASNNLLTMQIAVEEECRDSLWRTIDEKTKQLMADSVSRHREIGKKIDDILIGYSELNGMPAGEKTALLDKFIAELTKKLSVADLHLTDFISIIAELNRSNWSFTELTKAHESEMNGKFLTQKKMDARKEIENAYMECVTFINAMAVYNGDEAYADIIDQINSLVEKAMETDTIEKEV